MDPKDGLAIGTWPVPERAVRVVIPAEVAFDLGRMKTVLANLAERLGCAQCLSGVHCAFMIERDFLVDPKSLAVDPVG